MSKHNILFYSSHAKDIISDNIIKELNKRPLLKNQFALICVNSPGIKLPKMIIEKNEIPVIITRGFASPITGEAALNWIREHNSDKAVGLDYGDPSKAAQISEDHGILAAESGRTSYHQSFNNEWNLGTENDSRTINSAYSQIEDMNNIDTLEEKSKHNTSGLKNDLDHRLKSLDVQRQREVQPPLNRIGGLPSQDGKSSGMTLNQVFSDSRQGQGQGAPMYQPFRQPPPPGQMLFNPNQPIQSRDPQSKSSMNNPYNPTGMMGRPMSDSNIFPPQHPTPPQNPLYPNRDYPGNLGPAKAGVNRFPTLPDGFGMSGGGGGANFSSFDSAFTGQTLMGTKMETKFNNTRREKTINPGLPGGLGHGGPVSDMINTSGY